MLTCEDRPDRTCQHCAEQGRFRGWQVADSLADCPSEYLPPSAQQCEITEMLKWLDLCA